MDEERIPEEPQPAPPEAAAEQPTATQTAPPQPEPAGQTQKPKRKISEKQIKMAVFAIVIISMAGILLWGMVPEDIYEVHQVAQDPSQYLDKEIQLKGVVADWNVTDHFVLKDQDPAKNFTIQVNHTSVFPDGFGNDETVVIKGLFTQVNGTYVMQSVSMQIGCPSKY